MTKDNPPAGASPTPGLAPDPQPNPGGTEYYPPKEAPPPGEWTLGEDLIYSWSGDDPKSDIAQRWLFTVLKAALAAARRFDAPGSEVPGRAPEVKHLHEICQTNAALIGELPEAGRKAIESYVG